MYEITGVRTEAERAAFLALPGRLYSRSRRTQNAAEEAQLLAGTHILSHCFSFTGLLCLRDKVPCARCAVTVYPDTKTAYFGFFEAEDDLSGVRALLNEAARLARGHGATHFVGPVDASFWIRYRLKANRFDERPYVSEPGGKPYYAALLEACGFSVEDAYISKETLIKSPQTSRNVV